MNGIENLELQHLERIAKRPRKVVVFANMLKVSSEFSILDKRKQEALMESRKRFQKPRGEIKGWSEESRKRLLNFINSIHGVGYRKYMVTLTYGENYPDWETSKGHLNYFGKNFLSRIIPEYGIEKWFAVWSLEFQKRDAPHYHTLLYTSSPIPMYDFQNRATEFWISCTDEFSGDPRYAVDAKECWHDHVAYIAGHALKVGQIRDWCSGRWWGAWNRKHLDASSIMEVRELSEYRYAVMKRFLTKYKIKKIKDQRRRRIKEALEKGEDTKKIKMGKIKFRDGGMGMSAVMPLRDTLRLVDWIMLFPEKSPAETQKEFEEKNPF